MKTNGHLSKDGFDKIIKFVSQMNHKKTRNLESSETKRQTHMY
jgi:thioredoxin-related protein